MNGQYLTLASILLVFCPLFCGIVTGIFGNLVHKLYSQLLTVLGMTISFACSLYLCNAFLLQHHLPYEQTFYTWAISENFTVPVAFLVDQLSVMMAAIVTFISLLVHIYSIGYMSDDKSNPRFFSYISLFTFSMLILVMANNMLLLFFGWEGVGLVSYLLIGFWFTRESANQGSLKAFLVNRVADFAFFLGIAAVYTYCHSMNYSAIFASAPTLVNQTISLIPHHAWSVVTVMCILIFIGAMGKSAQLPLHVWLPESMEGPTPISALIHAATMVTAGIYLLARLSPLFEYSNTALTVVLFIGATQALFMGLLGVVQTDIKRVIAYSTLSQLGYMVAGLGASAFSASMFHLYTHACFKALLFLAAGAVIIALHHEQDMRKMGGLARKMPLTYITFLIGAIALSAFPPSSGFYSKDTIIATVELSKLPVSHYAAFCLVAGVFVTALYIFRAFFLVFHTKPRMSPEEYAHTHETSSVMWLPLVLLAIPSVILGELLIGPLLFSPESWFGKTLFVLPANDVLATLAAHYHGPWAMALEALKAKEFWLGLAGMVTAWLAYVAFPTWPQILATKLSWLYQILVNKYGFDAFNNLVFVRGSRAMSEGFYQDLELKVIDRSLVDGSGRGVLWLSRLSQKLQSGYLYQYALIMVLALLVLMVWQIW